MKNLFFWLGTFLSLQVCLPSVSMAQPNLITNGDFETQYPGTPPSTELNIKGDLSYYADELPSWMVPSAGSSIVTINATFLATNASSSNVNPAAPSNTFGSLFQPHNNSVGCVGLKRSVFYPAYDGLITQRVALVSGRQYRFGYYIMKRPGSGYASKFAFNVIYSNTTPVLNATYSTSSFQPAPSVTVTSDFITATDWVYVTGSFVAPPNPANTQSWIVLGYDRSSEQVDPNSGSTSGNEVYIIDDVTLQDMGCAVPNDPQVLTPDWTCAMGSRGPVQATIDDYNPAYTYAVRATNNLSAGAITVVNGKGRFQIRSNQAGATGTITVTATTICGASAATSFDLTSPDCGGGSGPRATAYPNPTSESLTVPTNNQEATLFNSQGRPVRRADASGKINVRELPAGIYNLQMQQGAERINQRIEIKH